MASIAEGFPQGQPASTESTQSRREFLTGGLMACRSLAALTMLGSCDAHAASTIPEFGTPKGPDDGSYWARVREQFLIEPGLTYLNNGGLGVPPKQAVEAVTEGYQRLSMRGDQAEFGLYDRIWSQVMQPLAQLVGADSNEIALTRNATEALNIIANGIEMSPGDEVLTVLCHN